MKNAKRIRNVVMVVALAAVVALASVGGTIAFLSDKTNTITNTFTVGKVEIELTETKNLNADGRFVVKMIPGSIYEKDPVVTVKADSEDCYLFVKFEEDASAKVDFISSLTAANGWTPVTGENNVWYREVPASANDISFHLLDGDSVSIKETVTNDPDAVPVTMQYTAYAVQKANLTVDEAWNEVNN